MTAELAAPDHRLQDHIAKVERELHRVEQRLARLAGDLDQIADAMAAQWAKVECHLGEAYP